jgi:hypothetical protein
MKLISVLFPVPSGKKGTEVLDFLCQKATQFVESNKVTRISSFRC